MVTAHHLFQQFQRTDFVECCGVGSRKLFQSFNKTVPATKANPYSDPALLKPLQGKTNAIFSLAKRDPLITYHQLRDATNLLIFNTTFLRFLKELGYGHWRAKKRLKLTAEHAKLRYKWAKVCKG